jgi:hypothetical protein
VILRLVPSVACAGATTGGGTSTIASGAVRVEDASTAVCTCGRGGGSGETINETTPTTAAMTVTEISANIHCLARRSC